jgi:hypothetical protein
MIRRRPTYVRDDFFTGTSQDPVPGSREHYFHFLIGYLLPLVHSLTTEPAEDCRVLDCGPVMTPILSETLARLDLTRKIVQASAIRRRRFVPSWDRGWESTADVRAAAEKVSTAWRDYRCDQPDCPSSENIILQRSPPPGYYLAGGGAEAPGYGTARRSITNLSEVGTFLREHSIDHAIYEPGRHCLGCQIEVFRRARRVAGMRGAEWANAVWSSPGQRVRVLDPSPPARRLQKLFASLDVHADLVPVSGNSVTEDPVDVMRFFTDQDTQSQATKAE